MKHQFAESYYGSDNPQKCINERIAEGCWVIAAFGDAHRCTVVYEKNINPKDMFQQRKLVYNGIKPKQ